MAITIAQLEATIRLETSQLTKGLADSTKGLTELRKEVSATSNALGREVTTASAAATRGLASVDSMSKRFSATLKGLSGPDVTAATAGLGRFAGVAQNVSTLAAQAGVNTGILGAAAGALASPFGIAAAGGVVLGLAIKATTDFMVANYDQMRRLIAVSGLQAEAADQLGDTFDLLGLNSEALTTALFRMSAEVDSGGKQLREIGVELRTVGGELKTEGALFLEARNRISEMTSASERNAAAQRIFGRGAREMAEVFAMSTAEFEKWLDKAGLMGPSAEESMRVTKEYTRAQAEFTKTLHGVVEMVGQKVLPVLTDLLHVTQALANIAVKPITITASFVVSGWEKFQEIRDKVGDWVNWAATGGRAKIGMGRLDDLRAEPEMDQLGSGVGLAKPVTLMKAEVEQQRMALKEMEADRLRSIALVQANMQAALKLNQADESEAAQQSIRLAQQTFAAKAAAIDGEIALIRRTSTEAIRDGTEAGDKIRALLGQRKDAHGQMSVAVIGLEAAITKAALDGQREIMAGSIETLKARLSSSAALLGIKQQSVLDIVGVQGGDEAVFRARLDAETQAKVEAAEAQTKTSADYAAAVEAIMAAHYAKLGGFLREALDRDIAAMPEALGELGRSIALVGEATEADVTPLEKAFEDLRLEMFEVEQASAALGARFDKTSALIKAEEQNVKLLTAQFGPLSDKVRAAVGELDRLKGAQYAESLAALDAQAKVLGPDFDIVGKKIALAEQELARLAIVSNGEATPAMVKLQTELNGLRQFESLKGMFTDVFSSFSRAFSTSVQGVIMGTTTMDDAFKRLGQSVLLTLLDTIINRGLKVLANAIWDFVSNLFSGLSGGSFGGLGDWISTAIGGIAALVGFSSSSTDKTVAAITATGDAFDTVSTSVSAAGKGVDVFTGSMGKTLGVLGGVAALGTSIFGLVQGIQSGSATGILTGAAGTLLSAYSLASSISGLVGSTLFPPISILLAQGFAAIAPATAAAVGTALSGVLSPALTAALTGTTAAAVGTTAGATAGGSMLASLSSILSTLGPVLAAYAAIAGPFLIGGFAGMQADAEDAAQEAREMRGQLLAVASALVLVSDRFEELTTALGPAHLLGTLAELQSALESLPDIAKAAFMGATDLTAAAPELRAKFGATLIAALDAASAQGVDGASFVTDRNRRLRDPMVGGVESAGFERQVTTILPHIDEFRRWGESFKSLDAAIKVQQHFLESVLIDEQGRVSGRDGGAAPDWVVDGPQNTQFLDVVKMNAQLDREALTIALRNAVIDVGGMLGLGAEKFGALTPAGSADEWQASNTNWDPLPSVAAIAEVQAALDAAGFVAGEYGKALEAYLISVDANVVNHPLWEKYSAALKGATSAKDVADALNALERTPESFAAAAGAIVQGLQSAIAEQVKAMGATTDPAARAAIQTVVTGLQEQLLAWSTGLSDLFTTAVGMADMMPPDLAGAFRDAMTPMYDDLMDVMVNGTAEQATQFAQAFQAQLAVWQGFSEAVEAATRTAAVLPADMGARFTAAMATQYEKILAALEAGNLQVAAALIDKFAKLTATWERFGQIATQGIDVATLLPDDLGARFEAIMRPQYDKILATLESGNADLAAAQLDKFTRQLTAWAAIGQIVQKITVEIAGLTGDFEATAASWVAAQGQMNAAVERTKAAFDQAVAGGDVERIAVTAAAYHDATMARWQAEMQMVQQIEAAIQRTLESATSLVEMVTRIALLEIEAGGGLGTIQALLGSLAGLAQSGTTAAARMWAVQAGLQAIVAVMPGLITQFASFRTAAQWLNAGMQTAEQLQFGAGGPRGITEAIVAGANPFLAAQQTEINAATGPAKLGLLQQQAATFESLAQAAIDGVTQWANQAIAGAQEAAKIVLDGLAKERDAKLALIDTQIERLRESEQLAQESRRAEMEALQGQIAKARELAAAVESMGKFLDTLKQGPLGPGNPADKLRLAQDSFAKALQAYTANPTASGLTDLQGLAQSMLSLAEPIFSKPSPQFQALSATTIKQLEAALALGKAQATDSEVLQAQLDTLVAMDKAATQGVADQIRALEAQKQSITDDFETQTKAIEAALRTQVTAIEQARDAEVAAIKGALITALKANATEQAWLIREDMGKTDKLIEALTTGGGTIAQWEQYIATRQDVAIGILEGIKTAIEGATGASRGIEHVTEGLYHLHDREAVLPAHLADDWRAGRGRFGIRSAEQGAGLPVRPEMPWENGPDKTRYDGTSLYRDASGGHGLTAALAGPGDYYYQMLNDAGRNAAIVQVQADLAKLPGWDPHGMNGGGTGWVWGPGTGPSVTPPRPPTTPAPVYTPGGPSWLYRSTGTATGRDGVTLVFEKGAIGPISGVSDPEEAAERVMKKLVDRIERGDLGVKILRRAGLT